MPKLTTLEFGNAESGSYTFQSCCQVTLTSGDGVMM